MWWAVASGAEWSCWSLVFWARESQKTGESISAGRRGSLLLRLLPQHLARAVALRVLASLSSKFKCKGSEEREVKKENVSKQVSLQAEILFTEPGYGYTFFLFLICSTQEIFVVVSWNSKHRVRMDFLAEVCGVQVPEKPLGFEVVCSFSLNVVKNRSCLSAKMRN